MSLKSLTPVLIIMLAGTLFSCNESDESDTIDDSNPIDVVVQSEDTLKTDLNVEMESDAMYDPTNMDQAPHEASSEMDAAEEMSEPTLETNDDKSSNLGTRGNVRAVTDDSR